MTLLLDTHIWLWSLLEPERLKPRVRRELEAPANELWLSSISLWEFTTLQAKGRLEVDGDAVEWAVAALSASPVREAPVTHDIALETTRVRLPHRDPADRLIVATARILRLTLVTADVRLLRAKAVAVLANR